MFVALGGRARCRKSRRDVGEMDDAHGGHKDEGLGGKRTEEKKRMEGDGGERGRRSRWGRR